MRILFLCNKSPWPPREGGPMAMHMFIEGCIAEGHQVKVLAVDSHKYHIDPDTIPVSFRQSTGIELIPADLRVRPVAAFLNLFTGRSYHVERFVSAQFRRRLTELLQSADYDVVQFETLFMCPYIETVRRFSPAKVVLRAHNIEHLIWQRIASESKSLLKRCYLRHLARTLKAYEEATILRVDGIVAITPTDAQWFLRSMESRQNRPDHVPSQVISIPFGIIPSRYSANDHLTEFPSLFSIGAMNWIPNQEGIRWFLEKVWPDIHNQFPGLNYYLAGREMPVWMKQLDIPGVIVLGEVADAAEFMARSAVMIVPLFSGSGIRIKIIEAMAAGKAIVSTSIGAEGIACRHGEHLLVADTPCEFFEMITACITDRDYCLKLGANARHLIEDQYNATILVSRLLSFYHELGA